MTTTTRADFLTAVLTHDRLLTGWQDADGALHVVLPLPPGVLGHHGDGWVVGNPHSYAENGILVRQQLKAPAVLMTPWRATTEGCSGVSTVYQLPLFSRSGTWSPEEDAILLECYETMTYAEIAAILGRTEHSVRTHRYERSFSRKDSPDWSHEDIASLKAHYAVHSGRPVHTDVIAAQLGRTIDSVEIMASRLGLGDKHRLSAPRINGRRVSKAPKYATEEERRAGILEARRRHFEEHGHWIRRKPGYKFPPISERTRALLSKASRERWMAMTDEQREASYRARRETNIERYGTTNPAILSKSNPYSRSKGGKREDLNGQYFRSAWEANYARYLNWLIEQGEIQAWEYEPQTFLFEGVTRGPFAYTPDFKITETDGRVVYHEIKGWMDPASKGRLKRMAKMYPDIEVIVVGKDEYKALSKWSGMIDGWEEPVRKKRGA